MEEAVPGSPGGLFITFEGVEGAGKTSRSRALCAALESRGFEVVHTREPGGTPVAEGIRSLLLDPGLRVPALAELFLYLASRSANVEDVVLPSLRASRTVVCERFNDATIAYQSAGRGLPEEVVRDCCSFATGGLEPDLTFLLDIDPSVGLARLGRRQGAPDRIEQEELAFHERVRKGYLDLASASPRFRVLDARLPWDEQDSAILGETLLMFRQALPGGPAGIRGEGKEST